MRRIVEIRRASKILTLLAALVMIDRAAHAQNQSIESTTVAKKVERRLLVSIVDRKMAVVEDGELVKTYKVAVGKASTPSPEGEFEITNRLVDPTYYHEGKVIPAGKNNPLGNRWMGLSTKGYGIHGTNEPHSIGKAASHGCIRMAKKDLEELFLRTEVGDKVVIRGERDEEIAQLFPVTEKNNTDKKSTATVASAKSTHGTTGATSD
jgi:lipoprotein-anchoring transpeptidase ErfK/SrfK